MSSPTLGSAMLCLVPILFSGCSTTPPPEERVERLWGESLAKAPESAPPAIAPDLGAPGTPLPLEKVLDAARVGHPGLRAARARWTAAAQRPDIERSPMDPMVEADAENFENGTVDLGRALERKIMVSQTFKWWGKLELRGRAAEQEAAMSGSMAAEMEIEVLGMAAQAYAELAYTDAALALAKENLEALKAMEQVTQVQYQAGRVPQKDVLQAQVEAARFSNEIIDLERMRVSATAELNRLLGRRPDAPLGSPVPVVVSDAEVPVDPLYEEAKKSRPELAKVAIAVDKARTDLAIAEKEFYPDVTVGAGFMDNLGEEQDGWMTSIGVNLPIWFGPRRAAERAAASEVRAAQNSADDAGARVLFEVRDAHARMEAARRLVKTYEASVLPQAEQSLKAIEEAYRNGRVQFLDVVDAIRTLFEVRLAHQRSRADYAQARAKLSRAVGAGAWR